MGRAEFEQKKSVWDQRKHYSGIGTKVSSEKDRSSTSCDGQVRRQYKETAYVPLSSVSNMSLPHPWDSHIILPVAPSLMFIDILILQMTFDLEYSSTPR